MSFWHLQLALEYARIVLFSSATIKSNHFTLNPLRTPDFLGMSEWVHGIKHKKNRPGEICMRTMIHYNRNADLCLWIFRGNWRLIVSHLNFLMNADAHLLTRPDKVLFAAFCCPVLPFSLVNDDNNSLDVSKNNIKHPAYWCRFPFIKEEILLVTHPRLYPDL